jgi:hypothetical protein
MDAVEQISAMKVDALPEDQMVRQLIGCTYTQSGDLVERYGNPALLDPTLDPEITGNNAIFTSNELDNQSKFRKTATVMKLVINGFAGAGCCEFGGYDYHDGTRATGEVRDFQAGQCMGAALEYAALRGQQLMIYVFSDGSVDSSDGQVDNSGDGRGKFSWRGDNSSTAASLILVYDPAGRPALTRPEANQIGHFRDNGSVETSSTRIASNVDLLAESVVLNYMALHDEVGRFDTVLPSHGLGMAADMDALVAFQPIRSSS